MPIYTRVDGNPDAIVAAAGWMKETLSSKIVDTAGSMHTVRNLPTEAGTVLVVRLSGTK